jgi:signal transduction histidine kinase
MLLTVSGFSIYVYERAESRFDNDAKVLIDLQLDQLLEYVATHPGDIESWRAQTTRQVAAADPDLRLGIQIFDVDGREVVAAGSAQGSGLALPPRVARGSQSKDLREVDLNGHGYPFLALAGNGDNGTVQVLVYSRIFARSLARLRAAFLSALPVLLVLTAALGWGLTRGSLRPIAAITRSARRISTTQLDGKIPTTGSGDELDELAHTLNDMIGRIREGVERIRRFSVDAAHQLRTPLAALQSQIDVTLANPRSPEERGLEIVLTGESKCAVDGDGVWLHQLFANLIHNALQYTPEGGRVEVAAQRGEAEVAVSVRDNGRGMSNADRVVAFARYQRGSAASSDSSSGLGLGLALAREIARAHGGSIELDSEPGRGSTFTVRLPLAREPEEDAAA